MKVIWGPCAGASDQTEGKQLILSRGCAFLCPETGCLGVSPHFLDQELSFLGALGRRMRRPDTEFTWKQSRYHVVKAPHLATASGSEDEGRLLLTRSRQSVLTLPPAPDPDCGRLCLCPSLCLACSCPHPPDCSSEGALPTCSSHSGEGPPLPELMDINKNKVRILNCLKRDSFLLMKWPIHNEGIHFHKHCM